MAGGERVPLGAAGRRIACSVFVSLARRRATRATLAQLRRPASKIRRRRRASRAAFRPAQRLVRVLAVQIDQLLAHRFELRERRRRAVDPGAAAALRIEHAAQQQRLRIAERRSRPAIRALPSHRSDRTRRRSPRVRRPGVTGVPRNGRRATSDNASSRIDLPAPVSPVSTVNPAPNSASSVSTTAKLRIDSERSIY